MTRSFSLKRGSDMKPYSISFALAALAMTATPIQTASRAVLPAAQEELPIPDGFRGGSETIDGVKLHFVRGGQARSIVCENAWPSRGPFVCEAAGAVFFAAILQNGRGRKVASLNSRCRVGR
jgi:hypothetical protein